MAKADPKLKLLMVEDDQGLRRQLKWGFEHYEVVFAGDRDEAIDRLRTEEPKVVTVDLGLPPDPDGVSEGFATLEQILSLAPRTKVIVVTGNEDRDNALRAISLGAYDFYQKPIDIEALNLIVERAGYLYDLEEEVRMLRDAREFMPLDGIITGSDSMLQICDMIRRVASTNVSVLLLGASGTGKELLARALHQLSPRLNQPFIAINCAAIPENLMESELFGYEKGAFTGAVKQTPGKIELAHGGTLFLDEIGDLPLSMQVKLLRFLQERVIERIGGRREIPIDVRVVSATHQDLEQALEKETFREDLFYRINEINIRIPSLKDRHGDAVLLANSFLNRFNQEFGRSIKGFSTGALATLNQYDWPGNVRELENKIKRAVIMTQGSRIEASDLDLGVNGHETPVLNLRQAREDADRRALRYALTQAEQNISRAAKLLGISRPTIYDLMRQYGIKSVSERG